jgi:error-prone DNA polymerase
VSDPFVHLHVASGYSLQYGASHPHVLVERAAEQEMDALALTDRDGVYGAVRFVKACLRADIRPILGVDLPVLDRADAARGPSRQAGPSARTPVRGGTFREPRLPRATFLAGGRTGWAALCRLVSAAHFAGERGSPVCAPGLVADGVPGQDLLVLLGPGSAFGAAVTRRRDDLARAELDRWRELVGPDRLVVEAVSHRLPGYGPGTSAHAARMLGVARSA